MFSASRIGSAKLARVGPSLGPGSWPKLLRNASNLWPSCTMLEPSWAKVGVGAKWAQVGALLAKVDPKSGQCCGHVGSERCIWPMLGRYAKCANYRALLAACPGRTWPPRSWSRTSLTDCQICPYHPLLNYHASAASARADFCIAEIGAVLLLWNQTLGAELLVAICTAVLQQQIVGFCEL